MQYSAMEDYLLNSGDAKDIAIQYPLFGWNKKCLVQGKCNHAVPQDYDICIYHARINKGAY